MEIEAGRALQDKSANAQMSVVQHAIIESEEKQKEINNVQVDIEYVS